MNSGPRPSATVVESLVPWALSGAGLGIVRVFSWALSGHFSLGAALTDAAQFLLAGLILGGLLCSFGWTGARFTQTFARRAVPLALFSLTSLLIGLLTLGEDVEHFSSNQQVLPPPLVYYSLIALLSAGPGVSFALGEVLKSRRWASVGVILGAIVAFFGDRILVHDYPGVHLFLALSALVLSGQGLVGLGQGQALRAPAKAVVFVSVLLCAWPLFFQPSAAVSAELRNSSGAAFAPPLSRLRALAAPAEDASQAHTDNEWFKSRLTHPPVAPSPRGALAENPVVILITVDALRADLVLSGKYDQKLPTLSRLRDEGISFSEARTPGTLTKVSLAGLFLGTYFSQQYWSQMEGRDRGILSVHEDDTPRFVSLLKERGVSTANFRSISWLRNGLILDGFQTDKYIPYPKNESYYTPSPPVMKELLKKLKKLKKKPGPSFIYSHLSDPHAPYDQGKRTKGPAFERYVSEVALVDSQLSLLVEALSAEGLRERCLLVVSADHGEAFGEHRSSTHGTTLYEEGMHVPLLFWRPGGKPRVVTDFVSLIDLGPTVLDAFGLEIPGRYMGQTLLPYLAGETPRLTRPIVSETRLMQALITPERMKLIVDTRSGQKELYDLKQDPKETRNLADNEALLLPLEQQMNAFFQAHEIRREGYKLPYLR